MKSVIDSPSEHGLLFLELLSQLIILLFTSMLTDSGGEALNDIVCDLQPSVRVTLSQWRMMISQQSQQ